MFEICLGLGYVLKLVLTPRPLLAPLQSSILLRWGLAYQTQVKHVKYIRLDLDLEPNTRNNEPGFGDYRKCAVEIKIFKANKL